MLINDEIEYIFNAVSNKKDLWADLLRKTYIKPIHHNLNKNNKPKPSPKADGF
ncbi:hypothetical protein GCM10009123_10310 [Kangiella japonica]|uniref:Uncharacterized protein n=1 Tax=Kangiella japonica TaxID=647384 RepID=A0ABN0SXB4_9GAMM